MSKRIQKESDKLIEAAVDSLYSRYIKAISLKEISRRDVYKLLGVSKQQMTNLETKRFQNITMRTYMKLDLILTKLGVEDNE